MRIEQVNENQVCCMLTREELAGRRIRLSELSYGSQKAQMLFQEVMDEAEDEFGFDTDDGPVVIEAVPMPDESLMILITRVDFAEELDSRFSDFSASEDDAQEGYEGQKSQAVLPNANEVLDYFRRMNHDGEQKEADPKQDLLRAFLFADMEQVERFACLAGTIGCSRNSLYQQKGGNGYVLFLHKDNQTPEEFNRICNLAVEYADLYPHPAGAYGYYHEHFRPILCGDALQRIAEVASGGRDF